MGAVQTAKHDGRRKAQHRVNKKNFASFAATEHLDTITMHSHVKAAKDSSDGVSLKMLCTFANLDTLARWICICGENAKNAD